MNEKWYGSFVYEGNEYNISYSSEKKNDSSVVDFERGGKPEEIVYIKRFGGKMFLRTPEYLYVLSEDSSGYQRGCFCINAERIPFFMQKSGNGYKNEIKKSVPNIDLQSYSVDTVLFTKNGIDVNGLYVKPVNDEYKYLAIIEKDNGFFSSCRNVSGHNPYRLLSGYLAKKGVASVIVEDDSISFFNERDKYAMQAYEFAHGKGYKYVGYVGFGTGSIVSAMVSSVIVSSFIVSISGIGESGFDYIEKYLFDYLKRGIDSIYHKNIEESLLSALDKIVKYDSVDSMRFSDITDSCFSWVPDDFDSLGISLSYINRTIVSCVSDSFVFDFIKTKPVKYWIKANCPIFAIAGSDDMEYNADKNINEIKSAVLSSQNENFIDRTYKDMNHFLQPAAKNGLRGYNCIDEAFSEHAMNDIVNYICSIQRYYEISMYKIFVLVCMFLVLLLILFMSKMRH